MHILKFIAILLLVSAIPIFCVSLLILLTMPWLRGFRAPDGTIVSYRGPFRFSLIIITLAVLWLIWKDFLRH